MKKNYLDEILAKKAKAMENRKKAMEFVQSKEEEISELKDRMINASAELDPDSYINLMKQIADKERELTALKDIADRAETAAGYTDEDVLDAFSKYCAEYNPTIGKKIKEYEEKKRELFSLYCDMAEMQKEALGNLMKCKSYLLDTSNKERLEKMTLIPEWNRYMQQFFLGGAVPANDPRTDEFTRYCRNVFWFFA